MYNRITIIENNTHTSFIYSLTVEEVICNYILDEKLSFNENFQIKLTDDLLSKFAEDDNHMVATNNTILVDYDENKIVVDKDTEHTHDGNCGIELKEGVYVFPFNSFGRIIEN